MDEVDNIIIHTIKQIGCDIEDDVTSLKGFSTELVIEAVGKCIRLIDTELEAPTKLPPSMSARFRVGTSLSKFCTDLGYRGEIGYQTFLYSNENEIRKVLIFLIEKLPKETVVASDQPAAASEILMSRVSEKLKVAIQSPWTPTFCKNKGIAWRGKDGQFWQRESCAYIHPFHSIGIDCQTDLVNPNEPITTERRAYFNKYLPSVRGQCSDHRHLPASLIHHNAVEVCQEQQWEHEWNLYGLQSQLSEEEYKKTKHKKLWSDMRHTIRDAAKAATEEDDLTVMCKELNSMLVEDVGGSALKRQKLVDISKVNVTDISSEKMAEDKQQKQAEGNETQAVPLTEEELVKKREDEIESLKDAYQKLNESLNSIEIDIKTSGSKKKQLEEELKEEEEAVSGKKESYKIKKRTVDLLPDAESNISKLEALIVSSNERMANLAKQWQQHKDPLVQKYEQLKLANHSRVTEMQKKLSEIKSMREKMKELANDVRSKEELQKQLKAEYEKMPKDVNRSFYTKRIMEIIASIKKQKSDIDKILIDTRARQKEINQLTGKLDRTFTVTDELIFKDAKKDDEVRKMYKFLAALHQSFSVLIQTVEETGSILREIRDLEDQIESDEHKKTEANLEKISADYKQIKEENQSLMQQLKNAKSSKN